MPYGTEKKLCWNCNGKGEFVDDGVCQCCNGHGYLFAKKALTDREKSFARCREKYGKHDYQWDMSLSTPKATCTHCGAVTTPR